MKKTMDSSQTVPARYSDDETDIPPELADLPFLPNTDPAILRQTVRKALSKRVSENQDQPDDAASRPVSVSR